MVKVPLPVCAKRMFIKTLFDCAPSILKNKKTKYTGSTGGMLTYGTFLQILSQFTKN
jgi:hypothetical protein